MTGEVGIEDLLRELAPQVLGVLMRRYAGLDSCGDAVQEALLAAATQWPATGLPDNPRAWLLTVATRRLADIARSESARREREDAVHLATPPAVLAGADAWLAEAGTTGARDSDDTLTLLFLCCHPAVTPSSQVALTLRAVGGLNTAEIARAFAGALARHHRFHAVRGHLLDMSGDQAAAAAAYDVAARYATNAAEKPYLDRQSRRVRGH